MTISAYQVDNVIKVYNKQTKARFPNEEPLAGQAQFGPSDFVTLLEQVGNNDVYQKISYTLLDLLKK